MTPAELKRYFPNVSRSTISANRDSEPLHTGLHSPKPEPPSILPLVNTSSGKTKGRSSPTSRYRITFEVSAVRPLDWDNYRFKDLQDCLVQAGFLPNDDWRVLEGCVRSYKVHRKEDEGTRILIEKTPPA
jgi:hypothetical protein